MAYWLLKTEPGTYSFDQLLKDKKTNWNGIRNFQARNHLRKMAVGDLALIYHSGDEKAVIGVSKIIKEAYNEPDEEGGDWSQVDVQAVSALAKRVSLSTIKATKSLGDIALIKQSRLSVMPLTKEQYDIIILLGAAAPAGKQAR